MASTFDHRQMEKKRKREFGQKEKTMKRIRCCVIGVFCSPCMHSCVKHEKQESVWIRREWWWKSGRQGEKSGRKRGGIKGRGKKWFWEKSFLFLLTVSLPLPFFPSALTTPQHTHSLIHLTPYNVTHWCTPSLANRAVCCCHWEHMAPSNRAVMTSFSFLQLEDFYYPIAFSMTSPKFFAICSLRKTLYFAIREFSD